MSEGISQPESPLYMMSSQRDADSNPKGFVASAEDLKLLEMLRNGDEAAFEALINQYYTSMLRLAMVYIPNRAVAEEVVQETWVGVIQGIKRFEARSSLKTWIFRILSNCAKTRGRRESRGIPFSSLSHLDSEAFEPAVDPERFFPDDHPQSPGGWASPPHSWDGIPEERLLSQEMHARLQNAIEALPQRQQEVITLRDIEGWTSGEVCHFLGLSEANQRVLLHRARSRVRRALEQYFDEGM